MVSPPNRRHRYRIILAWRRTALKIAVYVDLQGAVARVSDQGTLLVFEQNGSDWRIDKSIPLALGDLSNLTDLQRSIAAAVTALDGCRVFLSKELRGVVNSLLQEMGVRTWQSHGPLLVQLEKVARKESERAQEQAKATRAEQRRCRRRRHHQDGTGADLSDIKPTPVGSADSGHFRLDLAAQLAADADLNSWDILIPFLSGTPFRRLELVCDHTPRWLARALRALAMEAEIIERPGHGITATITPKR